MQEMPTDIKELQDLVEFLNLDREILMNENKRLKALVENNEWEAKYYEVLKKLEDSQKIQNNTKKQPEPKKKLAKKPEENKNATRRIKVTLKSQTPSIFSSPVNTSKSMNKVNSGNLFSRSKLDVTISKAYRTLITCEKNRSSSKKRVISPDVSISSTRFGTPGRNPRKV